MSIKLQISPKILRSISTLYNDVNRIFLEYIDNSIDSAEYFYDSVSNSYKRPIRIILAIIGSVRKDRKVIIYDNAYGITNLPKVVNSIADSDKKNQAWTNGEFGYGIYSFMACNNMLEITTKLENEPAKYIPIDRSKFDAAKQEDVIFPDPNIKNALTKRSEEKILFEDSMQIGTWGDSSGSKIILSDFDKDTWKQVDNIKLREEIEKHFERILTRNNLTIQVVTPKNRYTCQPYDYDQFEGEVYEDSLKILSTIHYNTKRSFNLNPSIKIFIKITKGQVINKPPIFISKGRRIAEIKDVRSFRSSNKSKLWDHPNVTGYIDLADFLGPTIARTDFRNDVKSKALFNTLIELESLILDVIAASNKASERRHYRELEDRLNQALSQLAKIDRMRFRTDYLLGSSDKLSLGSSGKALEEGFGGGFTETKSDHQISKDIFGDDLDKGIGPSHSGGESPGDPDGGSKPAIEDPEDLFDDSEFKGRERRKSGFNVRLVDREPDVNNTTNKPIRSGLIDGSTIEIFRKHPDFEERVSKTRTGKQKITQRLITYLAGEITVHYKDQVHRREGQPEYSKLMFVDLMDFVYQFEEALSDLTDKNLADLME